MTNKNNNIDYFQSLSEFKEDPECYVVFASYGLIMGRQITSSKSTYCRDHQGELVIFNANVITHSYGKIWYGDLNLNQDFDNLKNIADRIGEDLYILMEGDARFGKERDNIEDLIKRSKATIKSNNKKTNSNKNI